MRKTTKKQRDAVAYCEQMLCTSFEGNIDNPYEVSSFLEDNLQLAKQTEVELYAEFSAYNWDKL